MSATKRQNIKLTYFDVNGRASLARLILAVANVKYEDERIATNVIKIILDL